MSDWNGSEDSGADRARGARGRSGAGDSGGDGPEATPERSGAGGRNGGDRGRRDDARRSLAPRTGELAHAEQVLPHSGSPGRASGNAEDEIPLDIRKYLGILLKHRWLIAGVALTFAALGLFYTLLQTPLYRASATLEIKRQVVDVSGVGSIDADTGAGREFYETQYELLKSRSLAKKVAARLDLSERPGFLEGRPSVWAKLTGFVATGRAHEGEGVDIAARQERAAGLVMRGLSVEPVGSSRVVRISFVHPDRRTAQEVANAVARSYIDANLERRFDSTAHARRWAVIWDRFTGPAD